jgi:glyoxylase-like metal-dependent hydrolase (beta-lactamase superfamily II)
LVVKITYHCNNKIIEWQWASDNELMPYPYFTSCYLVDGLLIDSSAPGGENDFREFVKSLNHDEMIDKCFITHSHEDHAGNAQLLSTEFAIPIYTSKKAGDLLKKGNTYPEYRQLAWGSQLLPVNTIVINEPITTKSKKYKFELFPMIDHAPDLVALIEKEQQWAFVADAVQPKYKMIFGRNSDIQEDISLIYQSLSKLYKFTEDMDSLLIFSAGNGVLRGKETIKEKVEEIEALYLKVHEEHRKLQKDGFKGNKLIKKIVKNIFKRESIIGRLTQGDLSCENLIISLLKWRIKKG